MALGDKKMARGDSKGARGSKKRGSGVTEKRLGGDRKGGKLRLKYPCRASIACFSEITGGSSARPLDYQ